MSLEPEIWVDHSFESMRAIEAALCETFFSVRTITRASFFYLNHLREFRADLPEN